MRAHLHCNCRNHCAGFAKAQRELVSPWWRTIAHLSSLVGEKGDRHCRFGISFPVRDLVIDPICKALVYSHQSAFGAGGVNEFANLPRVAERFWGAESRARLPRVASVYHRFAAATASRSAAVSGSWSSGALSRAARTGSADMTHVEHISNAQLQAPEGSSGPATPKRECAEC
jgi:hypothetical protein